MINDTERREVARRLREGMENRDDGFIDVVESAVFGDDLYHSSESTLERLAELIEPADGGKPAAWRDFAADPPSERRPVLCKSRNGKYYVGSPCFFANDTFTGKVWVPRGANYRRPEKWMEIDAATCEKCDRDALIELADEIRALNENADIHLFSTVRISDTTLLAIERRIREAVGA